MPDEIVGRISVECNPAAYESLWDNVWANRLDSIIDDAAVLRKHVLDLLMMWKAANHTHAAPMILLRSVHGFKEQLSDPPLAIIAWTEAEVAKLDLPNSDFRKVKFALERVAARAVHEGRKMSGTERQLWGEYLKEGVFQYHLWSTQQLAYMALWDGYSSFVSALRKTACPTAKYRDEKEEAFKRVFGEDLYDRCFNDHPIQVARAVRNALSHAFGAETDDFKDLDESDRSDFVLVDGKIQIWPTNTRSLFDALKERVLALATTAAPMACFR